MHVCVCVCVCVCVVVVGGGLGVKIEVQNVPNPESPHGEFFWLPLAGEWEARAIRGSWEETVGSRCGLLNISICIRI